MGAIVPISTQTILLVMGLAAFLYEIQWILLPFVISGLLAYVCTPAIEILTVRGRIPRSSAAAAVFLVLVAIGAVMGFLGVPPLLSEMTRILTDLHGLIEDLARGIIGKGTINLFGHSMDAAQIADSFVTAIRDWIGNPRAALIVGGVLFSTTFGVFLTIVLLFYFLINGPQIVDGLFWLAPAEQRPFLEYYWSRLNPVLRRYFIGVLVVVAYATIAAYIGLGPVLRLPHAPFLALLTGILEILPVIGPGAAAVIAGLVAVQHATGIGPIAAYAVYASALRLSIDQILGPVALGTAARLHPVLIIFCFLSGGLLFGPVGVIMAVPVALLAKFAVAIQRASHGETQAHG